MGCASSKSNVTRNAKKVSKLIDKQLKLDEIAARMKDNLLLLGAEGSGKSTFAKQMKIIYQDGFTESELNNFKPVVFAYTVQSMVAILKAMESLSIQFGDATLVKDAKEIIAAASHIEDIDLATDIGASLKLLWADKGVKECHSRSREYQLNDSAAYYMDELDRLCESTYIPTEQDVLRVKVKTTGSMETTFECKNIDFTLIEIAEQSNIAKWLHYFQDVAAIIFFADISAYDQVIADNKEFNPMRESLELFELVCANSLLSKVLVILYLNKKDIFKKKITRSPLKICFPEYDGENEYNQASEFVREQFENQIKPGEARDIYPFFTCVTDTNDVRELFDAVSDYCRFRLS